MAYTTKLYGQAPLNMAKGLFDYDTNAIKVALYTTNTINQNTDDNYTAFTAANTEVSSSGTGYTTAGKALTTKTNTSTTLVTSLGAADTSWTSATFTCRTAVVYDSVTDKLLGYIDFGANQSVVAGTFTISWSGGIIATITCS
jgi:hypothetical protein